MPIVYLSIPLSLFFFFAQYCAMDKNYSVSLQRKFFLYPIFTLLFVIMGFRAISVGVDTQEYYAYFKQMTYVSWGEILSLSSLEIGGMELCYAILVKAVSSLGGNFLVLQLITSFIVCYGFGKFISDNSKNVVLSAMIFVATLYFQAFNINRQLIAIALCCNAWTLLNTKDYVKASVLIVIAFFFHQTALFFIFNIIVWVFKDSKLFYYLFPLVCLLVYVSLLAVFSLFSEVDFYAIYLSNSSRLMTGNFIQVVWVIVGIISIFSLYNPNTDSKLRCIAMYGLIYVVMSFGAAKINYLERIGLYFQAFLCLLYPNFTQLITSKSIRVLYNVFVFIGYLGLFSMGGSSAEYSFYGE